MTDYDTLIKSGFIGGLSEERLKNPRAIWISNESCKKVTNPDLVGWIKEYKTVKNIFVNGTASKLKTYCQSLFEGGEGNKDAAAITIAVAEWQTSSGSGGRDEGVRRVLLGTGSLNQDIKKVGNAVGQVHAEHITTAVVVASLDKVMRHYRWYGATLTGLDVLVYTAKMNSGAVKDFSPCGSCQITVNEVLSPHKSVLKGLTWLGS